MTVSATRYVGTKQLCVRYSACLKTVNRWVADGMLPKPDLIMNSRKLWKLATLDAYDAANPRRACTAEADQRIKRIPARRNAA